MALLALEDFAVKSQPSETPAETIPRAMAEAEKVTSYEQGYQAGWDDATRAQTEDQTRIGAEFARNLQELSFTFHEARAHVMQAMEPLLTELVETVLPSLVSETLGQRILDELRPLIEDGADSPVELVVSPSSRSALQQQMDAAKTVAIRLTEEPSLAEGQVYLRIGKIERQIDMSGALANISDAIRALYSVNERTLKHA
jgi:flagellar assembly protein FliH